MKKVLTIGSAMLDLFLDLSKDTLPCTKNEKDRQSFLLLEVGRKIELPGLHRCSGGGATNAAVSLSRQGFKVSSFFKTGTDCEAAFIKKQLAANNIDTSESITDQSTPTGLSLIFPCPEGDRTTITYRGANSTLTEEELPLNLLKNNDCLYVTSLTGETGSLLIPLLKTAKDNKVFIAVNPGSSQLRAGAQDLQKALPFIDVLIMNSDEALECMKSFIKTGLEPQEPVYEKDGPELLSSPLIRDKVTLNLRQFFSEVIKNGPRTVVVTNGKEGVYVADKDEIMFHPSLPSDVVSTLGAGDAFGSAFVGGLLQNLSLDSALIQGLVQAASTISVLDAQSGLLDADELKTRAAKVSLEKLERFKL